MDDNERNSVVRNFLRTHSLAVISTIDVSSSAPEAALITFAENEKLELFFGTFQNERKYKNLKTNPHVAFVIGWDDKIYTTVQYEGVARELKNSETEHVRQVFLKKPNNINSEEYLYHPKFRFFVVQPTWIRYSNYVKFEYVLGSPS